MNAAQARESLQTFRELFDDEILTEDEYAAKKAEVLALLAQSVGGLKRGAATATHTPLGGAGAAGNNTMVTAAAPAAPSSVMMAADSQQAAALQAGLAAAASSSSSAGGGSNPRATVMLEARLAEILDSPDFAAEVAAGTSAGSAASAAAAAAPAPASASAAAPAAGSEAAVAASIGYKPRKRVATLAEHKNYVFTLGVVQGNLFSGSGDSTVKVWDLQTLQCSATLQGHSAAVYSMTVVGKTLFTGGWDNVIKVWDTRSNREAHTLSGHLNYVSALCYDGNSLWSGSWDCTIYEWDIRTMTPLATIQKGGTAVTAGGKRSPGHTNSVSSLSIDLDGHLVSTSYDKTAKVWNRANQDCIATLGGHENWVLSARSTGSKGNATLWTASRDHTIKQWNGNTWVNTKTLSDHDDNVTALETTDAGVLFSGSMDKSIKAYDPASGQCCQTMTGHTNSVSCLLHAYDTLYSGSWDTTIGVWQTVG